MDRHHKQNLFIGLGEPGQSGLEKASVFVAGCGALGGTIAALLVRAGVSRLRVVDRDFPEMGNLGRRLPYNEESVAAGLPKAVLAEQALESMNSETEVQGIVAHLSPENILEPAHGCDLLMDGLDNQETRHLLNDVAVSRNTPWVYAGCVGSVTGPDRRDVISQNKHMARVKTEDCVLTVFADGRIIVQGTSDPVRAESLAARLLNG